MHEMLAKPDLPPRTARRLKATLARLRHVGSDPLRAARSLDRLTSGLADRTDIDHALLKKSAVELRRHAEFCRFADLKISSVHKTTMISLRGQIFVYLPAEAIYIFDVVV